MKEVIGHTIGRLVVALAIGALLAVVVSGCTKTQKCAVQDTVVSAVSTAVSGFAACSNPEIIKAKVQAAAEKLNFCPAEAGLVGQTVCPLLVEGISSTVLSALPADAHCTGGVTLADLKARALSACQSALPGVAKT